MPIEDVTDLSEHLRDVGYPNSVPFELMYSSYGSVNSMIVVGDALQWLKKRLQEIPATPGDPDSVHEFNRDKIMILQSAIEFFVTKASIRTNDIIPARSTFNHFDVPYNFGHPNASNGTKTHAKEEYDYDYAEREIEMYKKGLSIVTASDRKLDIKHASKISHSLNKSASKVFEILIRDSKIKKGILVDDTRNKCNDDKMRKKRKGKQFTRKPKAVDVKYPVFPNLFEKLESEIEHLVGLYFPYIQIDVTCQNKFRQRFARYFLQESYNITKPRAVPTTASAKSSSLTSTNLDARKSIESCEMPSEINKSKFFNFDDYMSTSLAGAAADIVEMIAMDDFIEGAGRPNLRPRISELLNSKYPNSRGKCLGNAVNSSLKAIQEDLDSRQTCNCDIPCNCKQLAMKKAAGDMLKEILIVKSNYKYPSVPNNQPRKYPGHNAVKTGRAEGGTPDLPTGNSARSRETQENFGRPGGQYGRRRRRQRPSGGRHQGQYEEKRGQYNDRQGPSNYTQRLSNDTRRQPEEKYGGPSRQVVFGQSGEAQDQFGRKQSQYAEPKPRKTSGRRGNPGGKREYSGEGQGAYGGGDTAQPGGSAQKHYGGGAANYIPEKYQRRQPAEKKNYLSMHGGNAQEISEKRGGSSEKSGVVPEKSTMSGVNEGATAVFEEKIIRPRKRRNRYRRRSGRCGTRGDGDPENYGNQGNNRIPPK